MESQQSFSNAENIFFPAHVEKTGAGQANIDNLRSLRKVKVAANSLLTNVGQNVLQEREKTVHGGKVTGGCD